MPPVRIAFFDRDHVLRLGEIALSGLDADGREHARKAMAPEPVDWAALESIGEGLRRRDGAEIILPGEDFRAADIILFRRGPLDRKIIDRCPSLKLIQRFGQRQSDIDLEAARARGIFVAGSVRPSLQVTAEHALLLMLAVAKQLLVSDRALRESDYDPGKVEVLNGTAIRWTNTPGSHGLVGRTLGLVGLGEIGAMVTRLAQAFGMRVIYTNRHPYEPAFERELGIAYRPMHDLLRESDFVSLHASNLPENENMIGRAEFAAMRPDAIFVNTARGRLVDEDALYDALTTGRIAGAGLDVRKVEPTPAGDRFTALGNVILTPHIAAGSRVDYFAEIKALFDNCRDVLAGRPPSKMRMA